MNFETASATSKRYVHGTHRVCTPEETLARVQPMLSAMGITRVANVTGLDRTGIPVVMVVRPNSRSITVSQGKGATLAAAKASGVMEAIEVWHAERIVRPLKLATYQELRREHRVADMKRLPFAAGTAYRPDLTLLWIEGEDLMGSGSVWLPFELVSTNYTLPLPPGSGCFQANTNGLASGNHVTEAALHGLCEVVERDATTLWRQLPSGARDKRALDLATVDDAPCREVIAQLHACGLTVHVWETTTDVGVASFVCLLLDPSTHDVDPEFGAGCHPARNVALLRALTESAQARNTTISGARDDYPEHAYDASYRSRRVASCENLVCGSRPRRSFAEAVHFESESVGEDLQWMLARLRSVGIDEAIQVDLTREALRIPVVRIVVPGLEGAMEEEDGDYSPGARARRFAGGRV